MPHLRSRYAESLVRKALTHSPIVGLIGHRQTGKTTLASAIGGDYVTLDQRPAHTAAENDPDQFLIGRRSPLVIDECQLVPELFPALKERIRVHPGKGQFILTGSVRFTSRQAIRESLTGRIVNVEMLPFSASESKGSPLSGALIGFKKGMPPKQARARGALSKKDFDHYLQVGGLPGICFFRDGAIRAARFEGHLETVLERDLRLVSATTLPYRTLRSVLSFFSVRQGQPLDIALAARSVRLSAPTLRRILQAFEALFLIRVYASQGEKRPTLFLEDQGLATHLAEQACDPFTQILRGLHACVVPQFLYRPELKTRIFQYRTRGGAFVPIAFHTTQGVFGILPTLTEHPTPSDIGSAQSFCRAFPGAKVVIAAHPESCAQTITPNIASWPLTALL